MTKRGYFIINGVPRVLINQIVRKSGIYYQQITHKLIKSKSNKIQIDRSFYVDIISQRGTWLRLEIDRKKKVWARMKKTPRIPALLLLQSLGLNKKTILQTILELKSVSSLFILKEKRLPIKLLNEAIMSPKKNKEHLLETTKNFFCRKFLNPRSYNLGIVGRDQLNYNLGLSIPSHRTTLTPHDLLMAIESLVQLSLSKKNISDIDNLENRRVRTSGELIQNQLNLGLIRLEKRLMEKIKKDKKLLKLENLFTSRAINSVFREFFGSNPLSQFLDQANPLSELTHKRRLTSVGPGGINRDTAGMAIRGIHSTHYGRICPIETPEGQNAGLVNSLTCFSSVDSIGSIRTPFFIVYKGQIQKQLGVQNLSAGFSRKFSIALNNIKTSPLEFLPNLPLTIQSNYNFEKAFRQKVNYIIVSSLQLISIATSLIPFLEHDDANRALMGSNMQRQAVPLIRPECPLIGTGFENKVLFHSGDFLQSQHSGIVLYTSHNEIRIFNFITNYGNKNNRGIILKNQRFCIDSFQDYYINSKFQYYSFLQGYFNSLFNFKNIEIIKNRVYFKKRKLFQQLKIKKVFLFNSKNYLNKLRASFFNFSRRRSSIEPIIYQPIILKFILYTKTYYIFKNIVFKPFFFYLKEYKEYNFQIDSKKNFKKKIKNHIYLNFKRQKKYFIQKNFPLTNCQNSQIKILFNNYMRANQGTCFIQKPFLNSHQWVEKGELLTNNLSSNQGELALGQNIMVGYLPWEGYNFEDAILINERLIYDDLYTSLHIEKYKIEVRDTPFGREQITKKIPDQEPQDIKHLDEQGIVKIGSWVEEGDILVGRVTPIRQRNLLPHEKLLYDIIGKEISSIRNTSLRVPRNIEGRVIDIQTNKTKNILKNNLDIRVESVYIQILEYKKIKIGDKIAGRHGNKGIISKILPVEDMPYFPDGTSIDMILNPLGVPSRMNIGQIFESLLGLIGSKLNKKFKILPFDEIYGYEASRSLVFSKLYEASQKTNQKWIFSPNYPGKFKLFDGRTGYNFKYPVMTGVSYMMKLIHLVDEKIHARSTGPYSLVTQQPLRGRSKHGGQRFGEMEVWALEGFGVAYTLQELLTIKSDDIKGRTQIMETILKNSTLRFGTPESFKVLIRELQALCLDVQIYDRDIKYSIESKN